MDREQFEEVKNIPQYELWMNTALDMDGLSMEDYKNFMEFAFLSVFEATEKNPIELFENAIEKMRTKWTASENLPFHGPWHHGMIPAIIMRSLSNNGYDIEDWQIHEAFQRGMMIPGGGCGFCGICGAGSALGIVLSLLQKSTPFHEKERSIALQGAAKVIEKIGKLGGVRCCRLSSYTSLDWSVRELEKLGYSLPKTKLIGRCSLYELNQDCHGIKCPYFPR